MRSLWLISFLLLLPIIAAENSIADGKVFARPEVQVETTIPNQQALIFHQDGIECLVIETAFLGEGTNFGWVVPLPGEPKVRPVSESFFPSLQQAFQPRLLHYVHHYYIGVLFVCGLAFLGWRSLKDDAVWVADLPLCLLLALGVGLLSKSVWLGGVTLAFTIATRLFIRSTASFTVVILVGMLLAVWVTAALNMERLGLIQTMGGEGDATNEPRADVTILSVQRAGVFKTTTIRGNDSRAILGWLEQNHFAAPRSIEPVVRDYVERGWVFAASKVQRATAANAVTTLHPLAFTFATDKLVYPLKLTGVDNGDCTVDLFVFGSQLAVSPHFRNVRCDRVSNNMPDEPAKRWQTWLRLQNPDVLNCVGNASVGTKLSATLTPEQMTSDAEISWRKFSTKAATVYSKAGAVVVSLNVGVPLAVLGWLLVGACRGGWGVDEKFVSRWRTRMILTALIGGFAVYKLLPKVAIVTGEF